MRARNRPAFTVAFCGITAALGAAVMIAGGFFGVMTYAAPLAAMVMLVPVLRELGKGYALLAYAATALITALVSPDKELAFCYVFIGAYPVVQKGINRLRPRFLRCSRFRRFARIRREH